MPIYEYHCGKCKHRFEALVKGPRQKVVCSKCQSKKVTRKYTVFGLNFGAAPNKPFTGLCNCGAGGCAICSAKV
jgi:putative FmdB family regulatory protein